MPAWTKWNDPHWRSVGWRGDLIGHTMRRDWNTITVLAPQDETAETLHTLADAAFEKRFAELHAAHEVSLDRYRRSQP